MDLSRSLLKEFAAITNDSSNEKPKSNYVRGTVKMVSDKKYVQLDGSESLTPLLETVDVQDGDRILVSIENHTATVMGNFTFPPSARKEQEAIDKADNAQSTADSAQSAADSANEAAGAADNKAQQAATKADEALEMAGEASQHADEAKQSASDAITAADNAAKNATEAKESASAAASAAETARQEAEASQEASANAQQEVTRLNGEVANVKNDINGALEEVANQAKETQAIKETLEVNYAKKTDVSSVEANLKTEISKKVGELQTTVEQNYAGKNDVVDLEGRLQSQITQNAEGLISTASKVEKLETDTTEAKKQVDEALEKASDAQAAATQAQANAKASQDAADAAKLDAQTAATKATAAQGAADLASSVADAADKKVQEAQNDLAEAKKNLTNVTNRVGATEEEIAAAQKKVDAAQEAVNGALADAAEANLAAKNAQTAADKAQQDATEAQTAATNAQKKADNAQLAADEAQATAEQAQKDVAALTKRVTSAETKIEQNTEKIELSATKTEEIGERLDNLKVGGKNLASRLSIELPKSSNGNAYSEVNMFEYSGSFAAESYSNEAPPGIRINKRILESNEKYVLSFKVKVTSGSINSIGGHFTDWPANRIVVDGELMETNATKWSSSHPVNWTSGVHTVELYFTSSDYWPSDADSESNWYIYIQPNRGSMATTSAYSATIYDVQVEKGTVATDWQPSLEDTTIGSKNLIKPTFSSKSTNATKAGNYGIQWDMNGASTVDTYCYINPYEPLTVGEYYTLSFTVSGKQGDDEIPFGIEQTSNDFKIVITKNGRVSATFKYKNLINDTSRLILDNIGKIPASQTSPLILSKIQLEKGNVATDFAPAPEVLEEDLKNNYYSKTETDARIKVESDKITSTVKTTVTKEVTNINIGGRNLFLKTGVAHTNHDYMIASYEPAQDPLEPGEIYTISVCITPSSDCNYVTPYASGGYSAITNGMNTPGTSKQIITKTFTMPEYYDGRTPDDDPEYAKVHIYRFPNPSSSSSTANCTIHWIKVEKGNKATDWTPAPEDTEVGGRNLLLQTDDPTYGFYSGATGTVTENVEVEEWSATNAKTIVGTGGTPSNIVMTIGSASYTKSKSGVNYVVSIYVRNNHASENFYVASNIPAIDGKKVEVAPGKSKRVIIYARGNDYNNVQINFTTEVAGAPFNVTLWHPKIEEGNVVSAWTPAPEDVDEDINNAQDAADEANSKADATESRVTVAESTIQQLSESISMLVTDGNGNSMMTQTADGWQFDISAITDNLNAARNQINSIDADLDKVNDLATKTNSLANSLASKTAYINITTVNSKPAIVLGQSSNDFKLQITNDSIDFMDGSIKVAYVSNQQLYIERAVIKSELQIGDDSNGAFIFRVRTNGNLGLRWES